MVSRTCVVSTGSVCTWLAVLFSTIALFAPYWFTQETAVGSKNKGIVLECTKLLKGDRECEWTAEDTLDKVEGSDQDDFGENFLTVQVLWILGCIALLANGVLSFLLCCDSCKGTFCSVVLTVLVGIAACFLTAAVIVFGATNGDQWDRETTLGYADYYDWAYVVAIIASICSCVATIAMGFIICCARND